MADELELEAESELEQDEAQPKDTHASEAETLEGQKNTLRLFSSRVALALAWLRRPDQVGQPLTLQPRGVRLLILLILGNLVVVALLTAGLYQASTTLAPEPSPLLIPIVATASPGPSPTHAPPLTPSPTPFGSSGAIAFTLRRNGNADIYALNQADRQLVRLTHDPARSAIRPGHPTATGSPLPQIAPTTGTSICWTWSAAG